MLTIDKALEELDELEQKFVEDLTPKDKPKMACVAGIVVTKKRAEEK